MFSGRDLVRFASYDPAVSTLYDFGSALASICSPDGGTGRCSSRASASAPSVA